jgi:hypothetical protein
VIDGHLLWLDWHEQDLILPYWFLSLLIGAFPASSFFILLLRARRRRCRSQHGLCRACGYDLRSTPSRCPECRTGAGMGGIGLVDSGARGSMCS